MARIAVIEKEEGVRGFIANYLGSQGHEVYTPATPQAFEHAMGLGFDPQIVVMGNRFGNAPTDEESGFRYLMGVLGDREEAARAKYVLMSGDLHIESPESVKELLDAGGHYVEKPLHLEDFRRLIKELSEEATGSE